MGPLQKRKHGVEGPSQLSDLASRPAPGTRSFASGKAVREGLASGSRQAIVAFHQQILTPYSTLPLAINHPTIVILQHYLEASPTINEVFEAWSAGDRSRDEKQSEAAVALLAHIVQVLTPIPFFRAGLIGIIKKLVAQTEPYHSLLNRFIQSGKREQSLLGLTLAAAAVNVDPPRPSNGPQSSGGKLALAVWGVLVEGGSVKGLGKLMGMRRRNREGIAEYGSKDPLDRPDIRHLLLNLMLPLLSTTEFQTYSRQILPGLYSNLPSDPPKTILGVLNAIWEAISGPSPGLARKVSLALLDENAIESVLQLLPREDVEETTGRSVGELAASFLEGVTCNPERGICFPDEGWYPRRSAGSVLGEADENEGEGEGRSYDREHKARMGLHNRILSNVVRRIGGKVVDDSRLGDWALKVMNACPEIIAGYWPHSALSLDPRLSARWMYTISYVGRIIALPPPPISTFHLPIPRGSDLTSMPPRSNPPLIATMIEPILPSPLTKNHMTKGLQHADALVQHMTATTLARALQKLGEVQALLRSVEEESELEPGPSENPWARCRRELEMEARRRVPDVLVIIAFAQKSATLARAKTDSEEEVDGALEAKSTMLTETALRLFGLYHKALPSLANEARFDVGKLLVSASSAKAERRERREAREGSVVSDSGSVGSIGTVGTAGMGGGFGQARGDVEGFEAMSQVHVLSLLGAVRDWNWSSKAAGSQYTYLYHILLLHLNTPHAITRTMTSSLLDRLLQGSILYEHDPSELSIWLEALPCLDTFNTDIESRARLMIQQIHLLSFLDDCFRRCMKTPYRYIEDMLSLAPDYFSPNRTWEMFSPLVATVMEQLRAKISGEHISTEAAGVVLAYFGRVVLGLCGKVRDGEVLKGIVGRLDEMLKEAKEKGQSRLGLAGVLNRMNRDLGEVYGGVQDVDMGGEDEADHELIDELQWKSRSFEKTLLSRADEKHQTLLATAFLDQASSPLAARYGHFVVHLISSGSTRPTGGKGELFDLLKSCFNRVTLRSESKRLKEAVFGSPVVLLYLTSITGDALRKELEALVSCLDESDASDKELAEIYTRRLIAVLTKDTARTLGLLHPWTSFLQPEQAQQALKRTIKHQSHLANIDEKSKIALSQIVIRIQDPKSVLIHLDIFVGLKIIAPFTDLTQTWMKEHRPGASDVVIDVQKSAIKQLLKADQDDAFDLLATLVEVSPAAAAFLAEIVKKKSEVLTDARILPAVEVLSSLPGALLLDDIAPILAMTAMQALHSGSMRTSASVANAVLCHLARTHPAAVTSAISEVPVPYFSLRVARTAESLSETRVKEILPGMKPLVDQGLQWAVRICSDEGELSSESLEALGCLSATIRRLPEMEVDEHYAEPVVTAVINERLAISETVNLATLLCRRAGLKASFVRQHLNIMLGTLLYKSLSSPTSSIPAITRNKAYIDLLSAVFHASTYASCKPNFIEPLLPLYRATLSSADQTILGMFQTFEQNRKISSASLLRSWAPNGIVGGQRASDCLSGLDGGKVFATCTNFPLRRGLTALVVDDSVQAQAEEGANLYDPAFVLPLFALTLSESLNGLDWVEILRSNVLGLAVCAMSSRDEGMRAIGSYCLARSFALVSETPFQERPQTLYTLRLLRHAIPEPEISGQSKTPRLPPLTSLFLAHAFRTLSNPSHFLYPLISRFLLQRPTLDLYDVPMLYSMLYASGDGFKRERGWMVRFIRDGVRSEADWRILKRRQTWSLMATLYQSSVDVGFRRIVLAALESLTLIPAAVRSLTLRSAFLNWISIQWNFSTSTPNRGSGEEQKIYLRMIENCVVALVAPKPKPKVDPSASAAARDAVKAEAEAEAEGEGEGESGKRRKTSTAWVYEVINVLRRACHGCDAERLEILSRILYRLSVVPGGPPPPIFPVLVNRVKELYPDPQSRTRSHKEIREGQERGQGQKGEMDGEGEGEGEQRGAKTVEYLFRASLELNLDDLGCDKRVEGAVEEIGWRVGLGSRRGWGVGPEGEEGLGLGKVF